jgi:hypothetical protein
MFAWYVQKLHLSGAIQNFEIFLKMHAAEDQDTTAMPNDTKTVLAN